MRIFVLEKKDILFFIKFRRFLFSFFYFIVGFVMRFYKTSKKIVKNIFDKTKLLLDFSYEKRMDRICKKDKVVDNIKDELRSKNVFLMPKKACVSGKTSSSMDFLYKVGFYRVFVKKVPFWVRNKFIFVKSDCFYGGWNSYQQGSSDIFYSYRESIENGRPVQLSFSVFTSAFCPRIELGFDGISVRPLY